MHTQEWLRFAAGIVGGLLLALFVYAGLRPQVERIVNHPPPVSKASKDSAATSVKPATSAIRPSFTASGVAPAQAPKDNTTQFTTATSQAPVQLTKLQANGQLTSESGWPARLGAGGVLALAVVAGIAAYRQSQQSLPVLKAIAPSLNALLSLPTHQRMLQERLNLSPRELKRFASKARVQHRQLLAAFKASENAKEHLFSVSDQIMAFQFLLLLEEDRKGTQSLLRSARNEFKRQLQLYYIKDYELQIARQEVVMNKAIIEEQLKETAKFTINQPPFSHLHRHSAAEAGFNAQAAHAQAIKTAAQALLKQLCQPASPKLLEQLYEMNTDLLA